MDVHSIDHIELYVADAERSAAFLRDSFGFVVTGRGGPATGLEDCESVLLRQHEITVLVTAATDSRHHAAEFVRRHGDGVAAIAFAVTDADAAFTTVVERGALPVTQPNVTGPEGERVISAAVAGFGDVEHRFVSRQNPSGPFAPGIIDEIPGVRHDTGLLRAIDHFAVCLPAGRLDDTVRAYQEVFGFCQTFEERIVVGSQAMDSKVVQSASGKLTFTIIEPDITRAPGQIDEFVRSNGGAGVQHVAFLTDDIVTAVRTSSENGVRFLTTPAGYYDELPSRLGSVGVPLADLRELNILADRDHAGVMLQIFTESRHPRRTFFYELIDRRGARTFGSNNIKALYEAVERQQASDRAGHA
jgi:4-hydroxymandelate synthase